MINVSAKTPYHTQVNNTYYPLSTCNTTSAIMWLLDNRITFEYPPDMQPEDYLTMLTESRESYEEMKTRAPWAYRGERPILPPRQVHVMLEWNINRLVGREVCRFRQGLLMQQLVAELAAGRAMMVSGIFTRGGHVVCLVGVDSKQPDAELADAAAVDLDAIRSWIIDDPYGDFYTGYESQKGNDVKLSHGDFVRLTRELNHNSKWAHMVV